MAHPNTQPAFIVQGSAFGAPATLLGQGPARIPTGGKIRAGIKVLTKKAAEQPTAKAIYDDGVAAGQSFEQIERAIAEALPNLKTPLVPRNVPWFTVRPQDFPNPEIAREIMDAFGEDRGEDCHLYRFPVVFPSDYWQTVMPHELAAWGIHDKHYWSQYSADGRVRHCMCHAPVPMDDTGRRTIRLFGGRKTVVREDNGGLCEPESCREYQQRQCNLTGRFLFFIPGIRSISAFELHTNSFYAMNAAIQKFETVGFLRGGRISGFLDRQRTPFYLTKKLMEVAHIDEQGRAVRVPQWIIDLEAPVDVTALLRDNEDTETALVHAQLATQVLQGGTAAASAESRQNESESPAAFAEMLTPLVDEPPFRDGRPSFEQLMAHVQACGIEPEQFQAYADRRWGRGWKINPHGRAHAMGELERYGNDPQGFRDKIDSEMQTTQRGEISMIRIAQFSDLHYGTKTLTEADRCFGAAIDRAIALGVQAAVVSGDATDHALDLHAPAAERLFAQVRRLADHCPVLMLQGTFSHEPPGTLAIFRLLGGRHPVHVAERIEQVALTAGQQWVSSANWCFDALPADTRALFTCVPAVNKAAVAATVGAIDAAQAVGDHLSLLLRGYAPIHRVARAQGLPTICVSHGTVFGCLSEHGVPMAGFDHEFTTGTLFAAEAQAVMLGHIHRHQAWEQEGRAGRQCIAYPGSIGRFHYGEEGEKGFLLWVVGADQAHFSLEPTPARRTVDIVFDGRPDLDVLRAAVTAQDIAGAFVRVRWSVADEDRHAVDRVAIEQLLEGAAETKLEGRIVPVVRTRAAGISQVTTLAEKIRIWSQVTEVRPEPLLACLQVLSSDDPEAIAERVLRGQNVSKKRESAEKSVTTASPPADFEPALLF